jgi:hypothetical protein
MVEQVESGVKDYSVELIYYLSSANDLPPRHTMPFAVPG